MQYLLTSCLAATLAAPSSPPAVIGSWKAASEHGSFWTSGETIFRGLDRTRELVFDGWNAISYSRPAAKTRVEILVGCDAKGNPKIGLREQFIHKEPFAPQNARALSRNVEILGVSQSGNWILRFEMDYQLENKERIQKAGVALVNPDNWSWKENAVWSQTAHPNMTSVAAISYDDQSRTDILMLFSDKKGLLQLRKIEFNRDNRATAVMMKSMLLPYLKRLAKAGEIAAINADASLAMGVSGNINNPEYWLAGPKLGAKLNILAMPKAGNRVGFFGKRLFGWQLGESPFFGELDPKTQAFMWKIPERLVAADGMGKRFLSLDAANSEMHLRQN